MRKLSHGIRENIGRMQAALGARVILSGPEEVGEGEQKIFQYLRDHSADESKPCRDFVYGLDADLIVQAMLLQNSYSYSSVHELWVTREVTNENAHAEVVYIRMKKLIESLKQRFDCDADDFGLLCVLLGNDFVPRVPCLSIADGGIDLLMTLRKQALADTKEPKLVMLRCGDIMLTPLVRLLELLAQQEDALMIEAEAKHRAACERMRRHCSDQGDSMPLLNPCPDVVKCHLPGWRLRYHHNVLSLPPSSGESHNGPEISALNQVDAICRCYLEGWIWSFRYNHQRCLNWHWHYPHRAAPTVMDLYNHLCFYHACELTTKGIERALVTDADREQSARDKMRGQDIRVTKLQDDLLQLLMVLPPQSSGLLPEERARRIMHDISLGACHMYPTTFSFEKYLKYRTWECHPILPHVNVITLMAAFAQLA